MITKSEVISTEIHSNKNQLQVTTITCNFYCVNTNNFSQIFVVIYSCLVPLLSTPFYWSPYNKFQGTSINWVYRPVFYQTTASDDMDVALQKECVSYKKKSFLDIYFLILSKHRKICVNQKHIKTELLNLESVKISNL